MYDNALPVGGKDDALDGKELLHGLEGRQQGPRGLVKHQQAVQGDAVAQVIHHQKRHLTRRDTHRMGGFRQGRVSSQLLVCVCGTTLNCSSILIATGHNPDPVLIISSHRVQRYQYKFRGHRLNPNQKSKEEKKKKLLGSTLCPTPGRLP